MEDDPLDSIDEADARSTDITAGTDAAGTDVIDSTDIDALRTEILHLRDAVSGAASHEAVLDDRVRELEIQVEELAGEIERLSRLTSNPVVRALLAATRPVRGYFERRRARA